MSSLSKYIFHSGIFISESNGISWERRRQRYLQLSPQRDTNQEIPGEKEILTVITRETGERDTN